MLHGRIEDCRVQHVGKLRIDAELRRAVDLGSHVETRHVLADEAELRSGLQVGRAYLRQRIGHFRGLGQIAVADPAARFGVHDDAGLGVELRRRHIPGLGRVGEKNRAGLRSGEAQPLVIAGDRKAADGGELVAEGGIAVDLVVVRSWARRTLLQSASSSSAKMSGSEVCAPCPISTAGGTMVTMPSSPIVTQALGVSGPAAKAVSGNEPNATATHAAPAPTRNERRDSVSLRMSCNMVRPPSRFRWRR